MKWLFRPSVLAFVSVVLAASAVALVLWPRALDNRALPQSIADGDREIVWLYAATNTAAWERFSSAVTLAVSRLQREHGDRGWRIDDGNAFPAHTASVPELSVSVGDKRGRLWFRWYKLTSDLKTEDWVKALVQRRPAPLAIIGGGSSDLAIALADSLQAEVSRQGIEETAPLLLLTTATADEAVSGQGALNHIYPGRTLRFCFTNRQMAEVVTDFIWSQDELHPDTDPIYLTFWEDDPYSKDLNRRFVEALKLPTLRAAAQTAAREWGLAVGLATTGGLTLNQGGMSQSRYFLATPESTSIPYSLGTFSQPNRWETDSANGLMEKKINDHPEQRRPLLILPAQSQPIRRFMRAMVRAAPREAQRFVVATGDALPFNTVYRDRNVAWPIQDLAFSLVFFCHRNPVDLSAGFVREGEAGAATPTDGSSPNAGTEDLLLFVDIAESMVRAAYHNDSQATEAATLQTMLRQVRWSKRKDRVSFETEGNPPLFDSEGNRQSGTGEHVVCVRPVIKGQQVLPRSRIEVWSWEADQAPSRRWIRRQDLTVDYGGPPTKAPCD
jgi:hypothetical protein